MRLFRRTAPTEETDLRFEKIKAEVLARVEDVTRNAKSAQLADIFSSLLEDDIAIKGVQPAPPRKPQAPAQDTQAA